MVGRIGDCNCINEFDKKKILEGLDDSIKRHDAEIEDIKESIRIGGIQFRSDIEDIDRHENLKKEIGEVKQRVQDVDTC